MFSTNSVCSVTDLEIANFNQELLKNNSDITIVEYVKKINDEFYKIDISFIDDFMDLVGKNECCIHHDMLVKYGVLSLTSGTYDVKIIIEQQKLESDACEVRICPELTKNHQAKNVYYLQIKIKNYLKN